MNLGRKDLAIALASVPLAALALRPLPLTVLVVLLIALVTTAAVCGWMLRQPGPPLSAILHPSAHELRVASEGDLLSPMVLPGTPATVPPGQAQLVLPRERQPPRSDAPGSPQVDAGDLVRRIEVLEARRAWLDDGLTELEAFAQASRFDPDESMPVRRTDPADSPDRLKAGLAGFGDPVRRIDVESMSSPPLFGSGASVDRPGDDRE
jgi:hypothetical protein